MCCVVFEEYCAAIEFKRVTILHYDFWLGLKFKSIDLSILFFREAICCEDNGIVSLHGHHAEFIIRVVVRD